MNRKKYSELVYEHYDNAVKQVGENNVMFVALYGSQNYGLDTKASDVDTKALILPTLKELISYHKVSKTIQGDSLGGLCDIKHVQLMFDNFMKQNINFIEILYTDYDYVNPLFFNEYKELRNNRDLIADANPCRMMHAAGGMAQQKFHALEKPFEGKLEVLAKYGYDPKQLASLIRLEYFCSATYHDKDFYSAIHPDGNTKEHILKAKAGKYSLEKARELALSSLKCIDKYIECVDKKKETYKKVTKQEKDAREFLDDLSFRLISKRLGTEIRND